MSMRIFARRGFFCLLPFLITSPVFPLADNTVRVDEYKCQVAQTEHFDIHYNKGSENWLPLLAYYLEGAWKEVGDKINYHVPVRTPFFFFPNHNLFEENNIVKVDEGTGGVTEAFKNRFLIFNDGSQNWLQHVIYHEFTHEIQFNVLYGGFWKSIRLLKSPFYPLWLMEGMAEYGSGDIDLPTEDMVVRDAVFHKSLPHLQELQGFSHLKPNQVTLGYKTGNAAMEFLADEYGPDKVGKSLVLMKDYFEVSGVLMELLGTDLDMFDFRFREWLQDKYADFFSKAVEPDRYGPRLTSSDGIPQFNEAPALSPDGKTIYYVGDQAGPNFIYRLDLESKRRTTVLKLEYGPFENIASKGRGLSVSKDGRWLAFSGEKKQRDFLFLFELTTGRLKKVKVPFEQIRTPSFSPVDDTLVCVGMNRGVNDIFIINMKGKIVDRLTDSLQDKADPVFSPDGSKILFSGEVVSAIDLKDVGRDIFEINLGDKSIRRIISLTGIETEPEYLGDGSILLVRDRDDSGLYGFNLFRFNPQDGSVKQETNLIGGAFSPRFSPSDGKIYYVAFNGGEKHLFLFSDLKISRNETSPPSDNFQIAGSTPGSLGVEESRNLAGVPRVDSASTTARPGAATPGQKVSLELMRQDLQGTLLTGIPRPYRFRASTDFFLPFFFYSTLDGLVVADIWQASDYLGNHSLQEQMQYASGANYLDLAAFYTYSRFRPDFTFGVQEQQYYLDFSQQDFHRELTTIGLMTYPLDRVNSVGFGLGTNDVRETFLDTPEDDISAKERFYVAEYFYDTVTGRYLMATRGQRFAITYQQAFKTLDGNTEYKTGITEGVKYFPLPRESTFVTRLMYGRSSGSDPQVFRVGGLDRIRGLSGGDRNRKTNLALSSVEWRERIKYLNYRTKWLFPDFFFKAAYLIVFDDFGYGWNNFEETNDLAIGESFNSAGLGISWPLFILQTFQMDLTIQWAARTDTSSQIWYLSIGPTF